MFKAGGTFQSEGLPSMFVFGRLSLSLNKKHSNSSGLKILFKDLDKNDVQIMSFYLVSPLVGISNGDSGVGHCCDWNLFGVSQHNHLTSHYSFSRCFGRTTTDFYELMMAYRRYFMKLFMFLDRVSCEESVNNDVLAQW